MKIISTILATSLILSATLAAQNDTTINKNVIVVKEFNPTIADANKINLIPSIEEPEISSPTFKYTMFNSPLETEFEIIPLSPARLASEPQKTYDQNYVTLGFGNYSSLYGELFYNAFQSEKHSLTFKANNRSSFGNIKLQDGDKSDATFVKNNLLLNYKRQFWGSNLSADLGFSNFNYRYYGYQTITMDSPKDYVFFGSNDTTVVYNKDIHGTDKPGYASFKAHIAYASDPSIYDELAYLGELYYDHFFTRIGLTEDVIGLKGMFEYPINENLLGSDLNVMLGFYGTPSDTTLNWNFNNFTFIDFSPYFKLNRQTWNLKLGINTFFMIEPDETHVMITPDIDFKFNLIENFFTAYLKTSGDYHINDYRSVVAQNPYISPELSLTPTSVPLTIEGGLKGQLTPKIVFNGGVKFAIVEDHPFFVNEMFRDSISEPSTNSYSNQFVAKYDDMNVLTIEAAIDYSGNEKYSFGASGAYYNYSLDNIEYAWHLPEYELKLYGSFIPYRNVKVNAVFKTISQRDALTQEGLISVQEELKPVYDLSLSGTYDYNSRISAFLKLNNVLGSKYYYWNGYPSFGFNAMIGAKYTF